MSVVFGGNGGAIGTRIWLNMIFSLDERKSELGGDSGRLEGEPAAHDDGGAANV
jgi:hypothetical protein